MAIISTLKNLKYYFSNEEVFDLIFSYFTQCLMTDSIENRRINQLKVGAFDKYYLTSDIFAIEQVFITKNRDECFIESHKEYIDFQMVINGNEQMEYTDINKLSTSNLYDKDKDLTIYNMSENMSKILLSKGDIAIFFPDDAHIGLPMYKQEELVRKTVIKLPIKYLKRGFKI